MKLQSKFVQIGQSHMQNPSQRTKKKLDFCQTKTVAKKNTD